MYYLKQGADVSNTVEAVNETAAWNYFVAVKHLTVETLRNMGYSVTKDRPS